MASVLHFLPPFMAPGCSVFSCSPLWKVSYSAAFCFSSRCVEVALTQLTAAAQALPYKIESSRFSSVNTLALSEGKFLSTTSLSNIVLGLKV